MEEYLRCVSRQRVSCSSQAHLFCMADMCASITSPAGWWLMIKLSPRSSTELNCDSRFSRSDIKRWKKIKNPLKILKQNIIQKLFYFIWTRKKTFPKNQGSNGIGQWPINWCTSQMTIHKITPSVDYNQWLKRFDTQLYELKNQNAIKVPKVVKPMNKKTLL